MATLKAMELENGQWVYVQVNENITFADTPPDTQPVTRGGGFERASPLHEREGHRGAGLRGSTGARPAHRCRKHSLL